MRLAAALCIVAFPAMAAMQPVREVASQVPFGGLVPGFYNGYVFLVDQTPHNHLTLYAPDGRYVFYRYVQPDFGPSVLSVAVDSNGTVAAGWNDSAVGRAGIDLMDAGGKLLGSFDTGVYLPNSIAFAADHSIWSFGWQRVSGTSGRPAPNYMAVRHYSAEGQQLGAYLPRSLFSGGMEPACWNWQEQGIYVNSDRIGLLACSGQNMINPEWVELDLSGKLIGRWRVGSFNRRVALTTDGHVYAQETVAGPQLGQVFLLDRVSGTFQPVALKVNGRLSGADGNQLVFSPYSGPPMRLDWYNQP